MIVMLNGLFSDMNQHTRDILRQEIEAMRTAGARRQDLSQHACKRLFFDLGIRPSVTTVRELTQTGSASDIPKDIEALNNRCWVRTVVGELQGALKDCNEALRLRPNFIDALDSRGLLNLKGGQNKNAIADFDDALKMNPRLTSSLYGRGLAKLRLGQTAEGHLDINNAKAMDPNIVKEFANYGVR